MLVGAPICLMESGCTTTRCLYANDSLDVHVVSYASRRPEIDALTETAPSWTDRLFETPPHQCGQRGDPHLWRELQAALATHPEPGTAPELAALIAREPERLTGVDVMTTPTPRFRVLRYPTAGMSGGFVSPPTWRDRIISLLTSRLEQVT
jgi:hypothetical protein